MASLAALLGMIAGYLVLVEIGKRIFHGAADRTAPAGHHDSRRRYLRRRAAYFSTAEPDESTV